MHCVFYRCCGARQSMPLAACSRKKLAFVCLGACGILRAGLGPFINTLFHLWACSPLVFVSLAQARGLAPWLVRGSGGESHACVSFSRTGDLQVQVSHYGPCGFHLAPGCERCTRNVGGTFWHRWGLRLGRCLPRCRCSPPLRRSCSVMKTISVYSSRPKARGFHPDYDLGHQR